MSEFPESAEYWHSVEKHYSKLRLATREKKIHAKTEQSKANGDLVAICGVSLSPRRFTDNPNKITCHYCKKILN